MSSIFVDDSDEFDEDSLNQSIDDSQFEVCESQLDIKEIPESPLDSRASRLNFSNNGDNFEMHSSDPIGSKKKVRNASKSLPNVYLRKDQAIGQEKILDYRDIVKKKLNKSNNFGNMKFKDFKQAQKALKKGNYDSPLHDMSPSVAKKAKIEIQQRNDNDKGNVAQKMHNLKQTLNILNEYVNTMQSKQVPRNKFINIRKSVIPEQANYIIVNKTIDETVENIDNDDDDLNEIPDSLENSETEVLESDLEDYAKDELHNKPQKSLFIRSRPTLNPKGPLYVNETINEMDNHNQMTQSSSEKDSNKFQVNDTLYAIHNDNPNSSATNLSLPNSSSNNLKSARKNTSIHSDDGEVKMKFFKKKKNTNLAESSNDNVAPSRNKQSDEERKMHTSVRKNYHKQLLAILCKQCQDDYATHDLSEEKMKKLIKECDRHRNRQARPKSPHHSSNHFWDTDFPSSPESTPKGKNKTVAKLPIAKQANSVNARPDVRKKVRKNQLELYNEWEADIDLNSRDSNVLHSTFIPRN